MFSFQSKVLLALLALVLSPVAAGYTTNVDGVVTAVRRGDWLRLTCETRDLGQKFFAERQLRVVGHAPLGELPPVPISALQSARVLECARQAVSRATPLFPLRINILSPHFGVERWAFSRSPTDDTEAVHPLPLTA